MVGMCLIGWPAEPIYAADVLVQELDHARHEVSKLATAASTRDFALQRKDAQVLHTAILLPLLCHHVMEPCQRLTAL